MKTIKYHGFVPGTRAGTYEYAVGVDGGRRFVVFRQPEIAGQTSITNVIEHLASQVLAEDLAGVEPGVVDFYEFYPPSMKPLQEWQKVTFAEQEPIYAPAKDALDTVVQAVVGKGKPRAWAVDKPQWQALDPSMVGAAVKAEVR